MGAGRWCPPQLVAAACAQGICWLCLGAGVFYVYEKRWPAVSGPLGPRGPRSPRGERSFPSRKIAYKPHEGYKSQEGQDKWADEHVFHGRTGGVFVDLGCYDGVTYSNTWYFERVLNWTGVCVEPNPAVFARIASQAGRASGVQYAVSDRNGVAPFVAAYMRSSLNASAVDYAFLETQGVAAATVEVRVTTPAKLLAEHLPKVRRR